MIGVFRKTWRNYNPRRNYPGSFAIGTHTTDSATVVLTLTPSGTEFLEPTDSGTIYLDLQPSGRSRKRWTGKLPITNWKEVQAQDGQNVTTASYTGNRIVEADAIGGRNDVYKQTVLESDAWSDGGTVVRTDIWQDFPTSHDLPDANIAESTKEFWAFSFYLPDVSASNRFNWRGPLTTGSGSAFNFFGFEMHSTGATPDNPMTLQVYSHGDSPDGESWAVLMSRGGTNLSPPAESKLWLFPLTSGGQTSRLAAAFNRWYDMVVEVLWKSSPNTVGDVTSGMYRVHLNKNDGNGWQIVDTIYRPTLWADGDRPYPKQPMYFLASGDVFGADNQSTAYFDNFEPFDSLQAAKEFLTLTSDYTDAQTIRLSLTPSAVETTQTVDAATVSLKLTPGATAEGIERVDSGTVVLALVPGGTEFKEPVDTGTIIVALTVSGTELKESADTATVRLTLTPSFTEVFHEEPKPNAVRGLMALFTSADVPTYTDAGTVYLKLTPSAVETTQTVDTNTVRLTLTPSGTEFQTIQYVDTGTILLTLTPSGVDTQNGATTDTGTVYLKLTPSSVASGSFIDWATALSPIAHWRLNEGTGTLNDIGSANADATVIGSTAQVPGLIVGDSDQATDFSGGGRAEGTTPAALKITSDLTIIVVIDNAPNDANFRQFFRASNLGPPPYDGYGAGLGMGTAGRLAYFSSGWGFWVASNSTVLGDGAKHTCMIVHRGTNVEFWIDDVLDTTVTGIPKPGQTNTDFCIGNQQGGGASSSSGCIQDELIILDYALSVPQIHEGFARVNGGTAADTAQFVDSGTVRLNLTPSFAEAVGTTDADTIKLALTPSSVDTAQFADSATIPLKFTPSGVDVPTYEDAGTAQLRFTPSSLDTQTAVDTGTSYLTLTPGGTDEYFSASNEDAATIYLRLTTVVTADIYFPFDTLLTGTLTRKWSATLQTRRYSAAVTRKWSYTVTSRRWGGTLGTRLWSGELIRKWIGTVGRS